MIKVRCTICDRLTQNTSSALSRWLGENYVIRPENEPEHPAALSDKEYSLP